VGGKIVALVVAAFSGVAMAVQGSLNAVLGKRAGLPEAVFLVPMLGTLMLAALPWPGRAGRGNPANLMQVPW